MKRITGLFLVLMLVLTGCTTQTNTADGIPIDGGGDEQIEGNLPDVNADECLLIGSGITLDPEIGGYFYQYAGFYDNTFTPIAEFYNVNLDLSPGIYPNKIVVMVGTSTYEKEENYIRWGLYNLTKQRYLLEPIYDREQLVDSTRYSEKDPVKKVFIFSKTPNQRQFYNGLGQMVYKNLAREKEHIIPQRINNYTWVYYESKKEIWLYNQKEERVKVIPSSGFDDTRSDDYVVVFSPDQETGYLYDKFGQEIKFQENLFNQIKAGSSKAIDIYYADANTGIVLCAGDNYQVLYNLNKQKVIDFIDGEHNSISLYSTYYTKNDKSFYHLNGRLIKTNKMKNEVLAALDDHIVTLEGNEMMVYEVSTNSTWHWDGVGGNVYPCDLNNQYFIVQGSTKEHMSDLYFKGRLVLTNVVNDWMIQNPNYLVVQSLDEQKSDQKILDAKGNILYEAKDSEKVLGFYENYMIIQRGNYIGVASLNGDFICRKLDPMMGDD